MSDKTIEPKPCRSLRDSLIIIGGVLLVILVLLVHFPALLLDIFYGLNLILFLLTFVIALNTGKDKCFSFLPSCLLTLTIFGLLIQISFARIILIKGEAFDGRIIRTFSSLMMHPEGIEGLITGGIISIILIIVTVLVFLKSNTHISEIAASFTLDALPIRLMRIDKERSSGKINDEEAIAKKDALKHELNFYCFMDGGASKFISGNFMANLLITAVSIIGGIVIGKFLKGETINNAIMTYIPLSICNGFFAQFLCLMESITAGVIVTRRFGMNKYT